MRRAKMRSVSDIDSAKVPRRRAVWREKVTIVDETDLAKPPAVRDVRACTTVLPVTRCAVNVGLVEAPCAYSLMLCCLADVVAG